MVISDTVRCGTAVWTHRTITLTARVERDPEMAHSDVAADTVGVGPSALAAQRVSTPLFDDLPMKSRLVDRLVVN